jgi:hypothetical protein
MLKNLELITHLRNAGFELGLDELLAAFKAIEGGWADSKDKLAQTLKLLWCKSLEDRRRFDSIWEKSISRLTEQKTDINQTDGHNSTNSSTAEQSPVHSDTHDAPTIDEKPQVSSELAPLPVSVPPLASTTKLTKLETYWPISPAKMVYAWRYLRCPLPDGHEMIDVERTITDTAYQSFYLAPSYRRELRNHAHLILLIDQDGSMMPFHPFTREIVKTAQDSTVFVETFYFHNIPMDDLYTEDHLLEPIEIQEILNRCSKNTRILIISDAGAGRGYRRRERVDETLQFLLQLQTHTQHIGWLNPMPEKRWVGSSANIIAHLVPMFEINPSGFSRAINLLQGL